MADKENKPEVLDIIEDDFTAKASKQTILYRQLRIPMQTV